MNNYKYFIMPNADLIQELMKQANLTEDQGNIVSDIFAQNFTAGGGAEDVIVNLIAEKLGVDKARAKDIYAIGVTVLTTTGILDKIKEFLRDNNFIISYFFKKISYFSDFNFIPI